MGARLSRWMCRNRPSQIWATSTVAAPPAGETRRAGRLARPSLVTWAIAAGNRLTTCEGRWSSSRCLLMPSGHCSPARYAWSIRNSLRSFSSASALSWKRRLATVMRASSSVVCAVTSRSSAVGTYSAIRLLEGQLLQQGLELEAHALQVPGVLHELAHQRAAWRRQLGGLCHVHREVLHHAATRQAPVQLVHQALHLAGQLGGGVQRGLHRRGGTGRRGLEARAAPILGQARRQELPLRLLLAVHFDCLLGKLIRNILRRHALLLHAIQPCAPARGRGSCGGLATGTGLARARPLAIRPRSQSIK